MKAIHNLPRMIHLIGLRCDRKLPKNGVFGNLPGWSLPLGNILKTRLSRHFRITSRLPVIHSVWLRQLWLSFQFFAAQHHQPSLGHQPGGAKPRSPGDRKDANL
jgi:hypothetical protein